MTFEIGQRVRLLGYGPDTQGVITEKHGEKYLVYLSSLYDSGREHRTEYWLRATDMEDTALPPYSTQTHVSREPKPDDGLPRSRWIQSPCPPSQ